MPNTHIQDKILKGRGAIVTGASMGLGYAIAEAFVAAGAHVAICSRNAAEIKVARQRLQAVANSGQIVASQSAYITSENDVACLMSTAIQGIDILVSNTGVLGPIGRFEDADWHEWTRAIEVNLLRSVLMCRAVVPHFHRRGAGKIIQIFNSSATGPDPGFSAYVAAKAGVVRFIETIAEELKAHRIDANAVAPRGRC